MDTEWRRSKYVLERPQFRRWFVFGKYKDGHVDISDGDQDVVTRIPDSEAKEIIAARDQFVDAVERTVYVDGK